MGRDTFRVHDAHLERDAWNELTLVLEDAGGTRALAIPLRVLEQLRRWAVRQDRRRRRLAPRVCATFARPADGTPVASLTPCAACRRPWIEHQPGEGRIPPSRGAG